MPDSHSPSLGCRCACTACLLAKLAWDREQAQARHALGFDHYLSGDLERIGSRRAYEWGE